MAKAYGEPVDHPASDVASEVDSGQMVDAIRDALYAAKVCAYAQGFDLLRAADAELDYGLVPSEIARIARSMPSMSRLRATVD